MIDELEWNDRAPDGVAFTEHKLSLVEHLVRASNLIYRHTMMKPGSRIRAGAKAYQFLELQPGFILEAGMPEGLLNNRWKVTLDAGLGESELVVECEPFPMCEVVPTEPGDLPTVNVISKDGKPVMLPPAQVLIRIVSEERYPKPFGPVVSER